MNAYLHGFWERNSKFAVSACVVMGLGLVGLTFEILLGHLGMLPITDQQAEYHPAKCKQVGNQITLTAGNLFLTPEDNINVEAHRGSVSIAKDSIVMINASDDHLAVVSIYCPGNDSVMIMAGAEKFTVRQGTTACLSSAEGDSCLEVKTINGVGYKHISCHLLTNRLKVYRAQFSESRLLRSFFGLGNLIQEHGPAASQSIMKHIQDVILAEQNEGLSHL